MRAWSRTDLGVGLLLVANLAFGVMLLRAERRISELERRRDARIAGGSADRRPPAPVDARDPAPASRGGVVLAGLRVRPDEERDAMQPPHDADEAFDRLVALARPDEERRAVLREAFERRRDRIVAAREAGRSDETKALWREYCDEVRDALDETALRRIGCRSFETAPSPDDVTRPPPMRPPPSTGQ